MGRGGSPKDHKARRRTCLGCRTSRAKAALARITVAPEGLVLDEKQALPGRGAYVCRSEACASRASRQLAKALKVPWLAVDDDAVRRLFSGRPASLVYDPDAPPDPVPPGRTAEGGGRPADGLPHGRPSSIDRSDGAD